MRPQAPLVDRGVPRRADTARRGRRRQRLPRRASGCSCGAFRQRQGAHELRELLARELAWLEPWLAIFDDRALYRLQAGPYATPAEAQGAAERIRGAASVQPMVLQRR